MICEVGAWAGMSTSILGSFAKENSGAVYTIDWFRGTLIKGKMEPAALKQDTFSIFKERMDKSNLTDNVFVLHMTSQQAVKIIRDKIFDLIFIDANHTYPYIKQDLDLWLPKVKEGGIFCGHDCEATPDKVPYDINSYLDTDYHKSHHPGVIKAVFEKFPKANIHSTIWWIKA